MEETSLSTIARKNRREVLGLLLGATFLSSAAFAQKKTPAGTKKHNVFIIIDEDGNLADGQQTSLSLKKSRGDKLYVVNLGPTLVLQFENSQFKQGPCVPVNAGATIMALDVVDNPNLKIPYAWCFATKLCPSSPCPPRAVNRHGGDITIDQ